METEHGVLSPFFIPPLVRMYGTVRVFLIVGQFFLNIRETEAEESKK